VFHNPVGGTRIVPFGQPRKPSDVLHNGHPAFRVTQSFLHYDALFRVTIHGALDLGNFYCGDTVKAALGGWCQRLRDPNGALGVRVNHSNGYKTEYWHLSRITVKEGQQVVAGKQVGKIGSTGLNIGGCHLHFRVIDPTGRGIDPWPLLNQNQ
jgi:murein DD-endopeptidase MepM/ murein hydrolase activator NlpD